MCNQLIADNSRIIVVMQKTKQQRQQAPLFSFNNSFKNSTTVTPDSSKYPPPYPAMLLSISPSHKPSSPPPATPSVSLTQVHPFSSTPATRRTSLSPSKITIPPPGTRTPQCEGARAGASTETKDRTRSRAGRRDSSGKS